MAEKSLVEKSLVEKSLAEKSLVEKSPISLNMKFSELTLYFLDKIIVVGPRYLLIGDQWIQLAW